MEHIVEQSVLQNNLYIYHPKVENVMEGTAMSMHLIPKFSSDNTWARPLLVSWPWPNNKMPQPDLEQMFLQMLDPLLKFLRPYSKIALKALVAAHMSLFLKSRSHIGMRSRSQVGMRSHCWLCLRGVCTQHDGCTIYMKEGKSRWGAYACKPLSKAISKLLHLSPLSSRSCSNLTFKL